MNQWAKGSRLLDTCGQGDTTLGHGMNQWAKGSRLLDTCGQGDTTLGHWYESMGCEGKKCYFEMNVLQVHLPSLSPSLSLTLYLSLT